MHMEIIIFSLLVLLCSTPSLKANEACGSNFDGILVTYRCPVEHHCCDTQISTCCPEFFICIENSTRCLHIAIVIVPIIVSVLIVSFCILCLICCCQAMNKQEHKTHTDNQTNVDTQNTQQIQVIDEQYLSTKL